MPAKTKTTTSLACPCCGACSEPRLDLDLNGLAGCVSEITCGECSESFTPTSAAEHFAERARAWEAIAKWLETAPAMAE